MVTITENKPPDQVQITQSTAIRWPNEGDQWPSAGEWKQLSILLKAKCPGLTEGIERGPDLKHGFLFLLYAGRRATPDTGRSLHFWTQVCDDWLQKYGIGGRTNPDALLAAAIVHGVAWSGPQYATLGITLGESSEPLPSAWKKILKCGQLPDAIPSPPLNHSIGMSQQRSI